MKRLDLDGLLEDAPHVVVSYPRFGGDRRRLNRAQRAMEDTHLVLRAEVCLHEDDPRLPEVARALAEALARFGL